MIAEVIVDILNNEVDRVFDYKIPDGESWECGRRVHVPFGNRVIEGYIVGLKESTEVEGLKEIVSAIDPYPVIIPEMFGLMKFMTEHYHVRIIDALRLFIPNKMRGGKVKELVRRDVRLAGGVSGEEALAGTRKNAVAQLGVITELINAPAVPFARLAERYSAQAVNALAKKGVVEIFEVEERRTPFAEEERVVPHVLTEEQKRAFDTIVGGESGTYLLHGVTGSGKTEIYLQTIEHYVAEGRSAIMLVPEISLTPQMLRTFRGRFGDRVAVLHSGLSDGERFDEWKRILTGQADVVLGARSAIFAPVVKPAVVIIDEEHDGSYVSETNPRYDTIEVAQQRIKAGDGKLILGSATPSISTYKNAVEGKYTLITLKKRVNNKVMPKMEIADMSMEIRHGNKSIFSRLLVDKLGEVIKAGNQAIIFINRRGYASFVMCRECGYVAKCEDCDASLTYHSTENVLKCHFCEKKYHMLDQCPNCKSENIRQGRTGTEKVVDELTKLFPGTKILRMDNDTVRGKNGHAKILSAFRKGEAQILVGTQMIAKGHNFPSVTLVGILDADLSLYLSDYRSAERTFQLVTQVAGRAGRQEKTGEVVVQTYSPKHYVFRYASEYDYEAFYKKEANTREVSHFPPYSTIVRLLVSSEDDGVAYEVARECYQDVRKLHAERPEVFIYLGAMRSPVNRVQGKFRYQVLARLVPDSREYVEKIYEICKERRRKNVTSFVEINPSNLS